MRVTEENGEEVFRVPLFVKAPGQSTGETRDDSAQNIDVLPSIVDLLGAEVDWEFDGHSLFDDSAAINRAPCVHGRRCGAGDRPPPQRGLPARRRLDRPRRCR